MANPKRSNGDKFRQLLKDNNLTRLDAVHELGEPKSTIDSYLAKPDAKNYRRLSNYRLSVFRERLNATGNEQGS